MTVINRSALLPYAAHQLYELVDDVESYPGFMEGCVGATVLSRQAGLVEARLDLAKGGIRQSFSTRNRLSPPNYIVLELIDGPFERFAGRWDFHVLDDSACKISLNLEFSVNSKLLGAAATRLFDRATNNLVDAVCKRATQVYG
ncbi:MAG: ribosome-associated toxin RatA of RatAB toxin-antitoxin module [Bacteroidia bacterium]|jgi:ribosome-associated toxin RatA of RatAB toxin-antitoxin module